MVEDTKFDGFRQLPWRLIKNKYTKQELANVCIPKHTTYDTALPQDWLDRFVAENPVAYDIVLCTTFTLYKSGVMHGELWSACKQVDILIQQDKGELNDGNSRGFYRS